MIQELDLTWEVFQRTVYAQQKDVAALDPSATGPQRKAHVERLLGLERFKVAAERARSEAKTLATEVAVLGEVAPDAVMIGQQLKEAEERAATGDPAVTAAKGAHEEATRLRDAAATKRDAGLKRERDYALLEQERKALADAAVELTDAIETVDELLTKRDAQSKRLQAISDDAGRLPAAEKELANWAELAEALAEYGDAEAELTALGYDPDKAKTEKTRLDELKDERTSLLEQKPVAARQLEEAKRRHEAMKASAEAGAVSEKQAALKEAESAFEHASEQLTITRQDLEHDRAHVGEVEAGGPDAPCPVCRKPYGPEYDGILDGYVKRIGSNERRQDELVELRSQLSAALDAARAALSRSELAATTLGQTDGPLDIDAVAELLHDAEERLNGITARLTALEEEIPPLAAMLADQDAAAEDWRRLETARAARKDRLARALTTLAIESYDEASHDAAEEVHERLAELSGEAAALRTALADVPHLQEQQRSGRTRLVKLEAEQKKNAAALTVLSFDPTALESAKQQFVEADARRDEAQTLLTAAQLLAQSSSQEVRDLRARLDEAHAAQTAIAEKQIVVRQYEVAAGLLGRFRDEKARRAWPRLEQVASTLLSAATDGRYADSSSPTTTDSESSIAARSTSWLASPAESRTSPIYASASRLPTGSARSATSTSASSSLTRSSAARTRSAGSAFLANFALSATASGRCWSSRTSPRSPSSATSSST